MKEALRIIGGGETSDAFPVSGVLGGALSGRSRDIGESAYQKHGITHHGHHGALDAQRRADALDAARRIGFVAGPAPAGRRMSKRERKIAYDNARAASGGLNSPFGETYNENVNRILNGRLGRV